MYEWKQATCCPYCGGELEVESYYSFSRNYRITKKGVLSKNYKISSAAPLHCVTAFCLKCKHLFEEDDVEFTEGDILFLRVKIVEENND